MLLFNRYSIVTGKKSGIIIRSVSIHIRNIGRILFESMLACSTRRMNIHQIGTRSKDRQEIKVNRQIRTGGKKREKKRESVLKVKCYILNATKSNTKVKRREKKKKRKSITHPQFLEYVP